MKKWIGYLFGEPLSWRKGLTAIIAVVFAFVAIGYEFGLPEIPASYQAIIAGVFGFYFLKQKLEKS